MKLFIDGYTKEARTLAANIRYCNNLQVKVLDRSLEIDNMDLYLLQNLIKPEQETLIPNIEDSDFEKIGNKVVYTKEPIDFGNDSWVISTTDADEAMNWCDCYANFNEAEWQLINTKNYEEEAKYIKTTLDRLEKAKELGKKIYLPFRFGPFKEESKYDKMFNIKIDNDRLQHMKDLAHGVFNCQSKETDVKLVLGTTSGCGKFSMCLQMKEFYETRYNERTGIIFTEDICDLINSDYIERNKLDDSLIINAAREWNDLHLEKWIEYVQYAVAYLESRGCKHILLQGQGTYGIHKMNKYYIHDGNPTMNINNTILEYAIGCNSVALAMCSNHGNMIEEYYRYFTTRGIQITDIFISSYNHGEEWKKETKEFLGKKLPLSPISSVSEFINSVNGVKSINPIINFYTNEVNNQIIVNNATFDTKYYDYLLSTKLDFILSSIESFKGIYYTNTQNYNTIIDNFIKKLETLKYKEE